MRAEGRGPRADARGGARELDRRSGDRHRRSFLLLDVLQHLSSNPRVRSLPDGSVPATAGPSSRRSCCRHCSFRGRRPPWPSPLVPPRLLPLLPSSPLVPPPPSPFPSVDPVPLP